VSDVATATAEPLVVRLELGADGTYRLTTRPVPARAPAPIALMVSPFRTDPYDSLLTHKTTARHLYDQERERAGACDCQEALFLNYFGRVTEGAITNIFARFGDAWFTPPVADGLLPGIWRADFLQTTGATERSLTLDDLLLADEIVVGNSVRGAMPVDTVVVNCLTGLA
jgi:para-aminobenzoate synthetase/4-amino-4-deoxychorismate lyase